MLFNDVNMDILVNDNNIAISAIKARPYSLIYLYMTLLRM